MESNHRPDLIDRDNCVCGGWLVVDEDNDYELICEIELNTKESNTMKTPIYPNIEVELVGGDGNAFTILGKVRKAMRRGGVPAEQIDAFTAEATEGDYDHLLRTVMTWVEVA